MTDGISDEVSYGCLLPDEFEERLAAWPIAYVPMGSLEWHGRHMPLGVDTLKASAICELVAREYGGIVVPGIPWGAMHGMWRTGTHPGLSAETMEAFYLEVFRGLADVGFRVIAVVSGHWTSKQTRPARRALDLLASSHDAVGFVTFDGCDPYDGFSFDEDLTMDHAAEKETSVFMYLFPERVMLERLANVDLSDLPGEECNLTVSGLQGRDPCIYASSELGRKHVVKVVRLIGESAREMLPAS